MSTHFNHRSAPTRRLSIVKAALACFAENGVEATTIADVRSRARASTGSIYHHFGDKDGLVAEAYRHLLAEYQTSLLAALPRFRSGRALVKGVVRHFLRWVRTNPEAARFLVEMRHVNAVRGFDEGIRADTAAFLQATGSALQRFAERGELRPLPAHLFAAIVIGPAMLRVSHWARAGASGDIMRDAEQLAEAAWRALAPHTNDEPVEERP